MWTGNEVELLLNITLGYKVNEMQEMSSDASCPRCSGRIDGSVCHLSGCCLRR